MSERHRRRCRMYPPCPPAESRPLQKRALHDDALLAQTQPVLRPDTAARSTPTASAQSPASPTARRAALPSTLPLPRVPEPLPSPFFQSTQDSSSPSSASPCSNAPVAGKLLCFTTEQNLNS